MLGLLLTVPVLAEGASGKIRDGKKVIVIQDAIGLAYPEAGMLSVVLYDRPIDPETTKRLQESGEFVDSRWVAVLSLHKKPDKKGMPDLGEDLLNVQVRVKSGGSWNPSAKAARVSLTDFSTENETVQFSFHFKKKFKELLDMEWNLDIEVPIVELKGE